MLVCAELLQLFATLRTVACQATLSMGFPRQEYWRGLSPSRGSSRFRDRIRITYISCINRWVLYHWHYMAEVQGSSDHTAMKSFYISSDWVQICFFFFFNLATLGLSCGMWDLVSWPGMEPECPALQAQKCMFGPPGKSQQICISVGCMGQTMEYVNVRANIHVT